MSEEAICMLGFTPDSTLDTNLDALAGKNELKNPFSGFQNFLALDERQRELEHDVL